MRGNLEAGEYKHGVVGLVFLMFISDAFEEWRAWLEASTADPANDDYYVKNGARRDEIVEDRNEYAADNVFWVPADALWGYLQDRATQHRIGALTDHAMDLVKAANPKSRACSQVVRPRQDRRAPARRARRSHWHDRLHPGQSRGR